MPDLIAPFRKGASLGQAVKLLLISTVSKHPIRISGLFLPVVPSDTLDTCAVPTAHSFHNNRASIRPGTRVGSQRVSGVLAVLGGKLPRTRLFWSGLGVVLVLVTIAVALWVRTAGGPQVAEVAFSDFLRDVQADRIARVTAVADTLQVERRDGTIVETIAPPGYVAANPTFVADLTNRGIRLDVRRPSESKAGSYGALALGLLFFGVAGLALFRMATGRVPSLEKARTVDPEQVTVTFKDVAGVDEA
ncbi:MAG: ATP-dependent metallopeptidase FtsH/Yme1/Tma family protein, partial [Vicinamibacterales bacterium]